MVDDQIHDDLDVTSVRLMEEFIHVAERAEQGVDVSVIGDVVTVVDHGGAVHR